MTDYDTLENNKALMRRWFEEVWNQGRAEAIDEMMAPDALNYGLSEDPASPLEGNAGFHPFHETFRGAFSNIEVVVEDTIAEGHQVAARCTVRARHTGDHLGIAASDAAVSFTGIAIARIRDGKFVESWNSFDFLTMNQQIGKV